MDAADLLRRCAEAYRGFHTYRDTGMVAWSGHIFRSRRYLQEIRFETVFERPCRVRFSFTKDGRSFAAWNAGGQPVTWDSYRRKSQRYDFDGSKYSGLDLALAAMTGISSGAAHTVPRLLLPGTITGRSVAKLTEPTMSGRQAVDGRECVIIEGKFADRPTLIWIDEESLLIRRIVERGRLFFGSMEELTRYEPIVNEPIDSSEFRFTPPAG